MNVMITGASRGIGFELVRFFAQNDNVKVFAVSRSKSGLDRLTSECAGLNISSAVIPLTVDLAELIDHPDILTSKLPTGNFHLDILINNAGFLVNKSFAETGTKDILDTIKVNWLAPVMLIKHLLPFMGSENFTHVVNISSMGGFQGSKKFKGLSWYSSSKAAMACMTECLDEEFQDKNIVFNCLALGSVQTEMFSMAFPGFKASLMPSEMAEFIGHFALTAHRFIKGKVIPVALGNP